MTETHKAAVEALAAFKSSDNWSEWVCDYQDIILNGLRTLKQPSSVEVTVEELNEEICSKMYELIFQDGINADIYSILKKYEGRIIRAAATDGVKS